MLLVKIDHETVVRNVVQNIGIGSFIDDLSSVDSKGLIYQDCEVLIHVNKQSPDFAGGVDVDKDDLDDAGGLHHARDETGVTTGHVDDTDESLDPRKIHTDVTHATAAAAREQEIQLSTQRVQQTVEVSKVQHQHSNKVTQEKTGEREKKKRKGGRGQKEEGRRAEEQRDKEIEKDVMGWTVATKIKKQRKRLVQIFVKVDGVKTVLREVWPEDKVQKILNTVSGSDQDVYAMCEGKDAKEG